MSKIRRKIYEHSFTFIKAHIHRTQLTECHSRHLRRNKDFIDHMDDTIAGFHVGVNNLWEAIHTGRYTTSNLVDAVVATAKSGCLPKVAHFDRSTAF